jgi:hypothetical protein
MNTFSNTHIYSFIIGTKFGRDIVKPVCNLIHPRLLIAVDWHIDMLKSLNINKIDNYLLHDLTVKDHESYTKFIQTYNLNIPKILEDESIKSKNSKTSNSSHSKLLDTNGCVPLSRPVNAVSGTYSYLYVYL